MSRRALLLVLFCLPSFFFFLGSAAITDSDEAYYAESAREMIESGDWITPHFNYEVRFEKPILFYWMIAATYGVAGVGEGAARFWAALSGVGLVLLAQTVGRRWIDEETGFLAGAITATGFATAAMARQSLPDLPLAFFITLAVWSGFEGLSPESSSTSASGRRYWLLLSAAACGLATLTKGPVGLALPVLILLPPLVVETLRRPAGRRRMPFGAIDVALALGLFLAVAVPWYAAITWIHGQGYLYRFFVGENLDRFATARYNDPRPFWFYVPIVIGGLLPWSTFAILWLRRSTATVTARARSMELLRLGSWALVPLVVFSVSVGKQPRYILPCLVPLAVILGMGISARVRATLGGRRDRLLTTAGVLSALILLGAGVLLYRTAAIMATVSGANTRLWGSLVIAASIGAVLVSIRRSARLMPMAIAVAAALTLLALHASLMAGGRPDGVVRAAELIASRASPQDAVCGCGAFLRNLPYYARRKIVAAGTQQEVNAALSSPAAMIAAVDARKLAEAETALNQHFERIGETSYLNTALLRLDDFIRPEPTRVIQRIVVIRTR